MLIVYKFYSPGAMDGGGRLLWTLLDTFVGAGGECSAVRRPSSCGLCELTGPETNGQYCTGFNDQSRPVPSPSVPPCLSRHDELGVVGGEGDTV